PRVTDQKKSCSHRFSGPNNLSTPPLFTSTPPPPGCMPPCANRRAAYNTSPTGTAYRGACTLSTSPEMPCSGVPARTGTANTSRASSTIPGRCAVPPVNTTPARKPPPRRAPAAPGPPPLEVALRQLEDLVHPLVDDMRQQLARRLPRAL